MGRTQLRERRLKNIVEERMIAKALKQEGILFVGETDQAELKLQNDWLLVNSSQHIKHGLM